MKNPTRLLLALATSVITTLPTWAAEAYPAKPVTLVSAFAAGSGPDAVLRLVSDKLGKAWNQRVLVDNRPGGGGFIAIEAVKRAPADGYTLLQLDSEHLAALPHLYKARGFDTLKTFEPVAVLFRTPFMVAVAADSKWKTMADLVAAARSSKKPLQLGNYSAGYQLVAAWLGSSTGLAVDHIPYKGGAQMLTDVVGGQLEVGVIDFTGTTELMKGGRLRVLAITAAQRDPKYPDIPTMKESGYPEFETGVWSAFFMRAETPDDIVDKLAAALHKAMTSEAGRAYQASLPSTGLLMGPKELGEFQLREFQRFKKVAEAAGIKPE